MQMSHGRFVQLNRSDFSSLSVEIHEQPSLKTSCYRRQERAVDLIVHISK